MGRHFSRKKCSRAGNWTRAYIIFIFSDWTYPKIIFEIQNFQKFSIFHSRPGAYLTDDSLTWFFLILLTWTSYLFYWQYSTNFRRTPLDFFKQLPETPDIRTRKWKNTIERFRWFYCYSRVRPSYFKLNKTQVGENFYSNSTCSS